MRRENQTLGETFLGKMSGVLGIYPVLLKSGFVGVCYRIFRKEYLSGRKEFYRKNQQRILRVYDLLADELSKEVYGRLIKYRCYMYRKDFPIYSVENQYFAEDLVANELDQATVFVDCGAYSGDTYKKFRDITGGHFKGYVAFEPDDKNFSLLEKEVGHDTRVTCIKAGVWKKTTMLHFISDGMSGKITGHDSKSKEKCEESNGIGESIVPVVSIDEINAARQATFIKMDIEGSELEALQGAEKIIRKNKPCLAICIYHSDMDMIRIAEWILDLNMNYKLYVRHHSMDIAETVLYAISSCRKTE